MAEAFGLGVDEYREHVIYDNVTIKLSPKDIVYITGESGSGKSILLRAYSLWALASLVQVKIGI